MVIQIIIIVFILFVLSRVFLRFKGKEIGIRELIFWTLFWIIVAVVVLLPQTTTFLADALGVGRGVDAIIYLSIIFIFYAIFRIYVKIEHIEHEITTIVRKVGLKEEEKKDK